MDQVARTVHQHLRARLLAPVIAVERDVTEYIAAIAARPRQLDLATLERTEWSPAFERMMRDRLLMGALRYGLLGSLNEPGGKPLYDYIVSAIRRLQMFQQNGSLELLADVANCCLLEYVDGRHPLRHHESTDDGEEHVQVKG